MNKQEALHRLTALEAETAELRKILEAPDHPDSLLWLPAMGTVYYKINSDQYGTFAVAANMVQPDLDYGSNVFQTEQLANDYKKAFATFLELRHQPGTVPAQAGVQQWAIIISTDSGPVVSSFSALSNKAPLFSPMFATKLDAENALKKVGKDTIKHMVETFHHCKGAL